AASIGGADRPGGTVSPANRGTRGLKMCLGVLDVELPEATIAAACGTTPIGTSPEQAVDGLKTLGFAGEIYDPVDIDRGPRRSAGCAAPGPPTSASDRVGGTKPPNAETCGR